MTTGVFQEPSQLSLSSTFNLLVFKISLQSVKWRLSFVLPKNPRVQCEDKNSRSVLAQPARACLVLPALPPPSGAKGLLPTLPCPPATFVHCVMPSSLLPLGLARAIPSAWSSLLPLFLRSPSERRFLPTLPKDGAPPISLCHTLTFAVLAPLRHCNLYSHICLFTGLVLIKSPYEILSDV